MAWLPDCSRRGRLTPASATRWAPGHPATAHTAVLLTALAAPEAALCRSPASQQGVNEHVRGVRKMHGKISTSPMLCYDDEALERRQSAPKPLCQHCDNGGM